MIPIPRLKRYELAALTVLEALGRSVKLAPALARLLDHGVYALSRSDFDKYQETLIAMRGLLGGN